MERGEEKGEVEEEAETVAEKGVEAGNPGWEAADLGKGTAVEEAVGVENLEEQRSRRCKPASSRQIPVLACHHCNF